MQSAKQEVIGAIQRLSDTADTEPTLYRLYFHENMRRAQRDAEAGETEFVEDVLKEIMKW